MKAEIARQEKWALFQGQVINVCPVWLHSHWIDTDPDPDTTPSSEQALH